MASPGPTQNAMLRSGAVAAVAGVITLAVYAPSGASPPPADHSAQSSAHVSSGTAAGALVARPAATVTAPGHDATRRGPALAVYPVTATPARPAPAHDRVAPARPTRFAFSGPGFSVTSRVCAMANTLVLTPPGDPHKQVCWVKPSLGVAPGSDTASSYILGHSFANDPHTVLGTASRLASRQIATAPITMRSGVPTKNLDALDGSTLTLWTSKGRLDYRVRDSFAVPKAQFGLVERIEDDSVAHRVVLVTCAVHAGRDLDYNVIVEAFLTSSTRA